MPAVTRRESHSIEDRNYDRRSEHRGSYKKYDDSPEVENYNAGPYIFVPKNPAYDKLAAEGAAHTYSYGDSNGMTSNRI